MRIVHVFGNQELNGAAVHCLSLATLQVRAGHQVSVLVDGDGFMKDECDRLGLEVLVVPSLRPTSDPRDADDSPSESVSAIGHILESLRPSLVHTHLRWARNIAIPASGALGIPTVHTQHDELTVNEFMGQLLSQHTSVQVVAVSSRVGRLIEDVGVHASRISVILNGVEELPRSGFMPPQIAQPLVLLACRLVPEKGWETALAAFEELRRQSVSAHLVIAGDGWQRDEVAKQVDGSELGASVTLAGTVDRPVNARAPYHALIVPSRTDTSPLIVLEAMSAGLPVIASDVGDVATLLRPCAESRLIEDPYDATAFAQHIAHRVEQPLIRDISARRQFLARYTRERMFQETMLVYERAKS